MPEITARDPDLPAIIADDLTGALDSGVQFARLGFKTCLALKHNPGQLAALPEGWQVTVINTDSRQAGPEQAALRCVTAAHRLAGQRLYIKIDSTLRGHVAVEIEAIMSAIERESAAPTKALICPAAPGQGRIVRDGVIYVNGEALHVSAFNADPAFPARTSELAGLLQRPTTHLGRGMSPGELACAIDAAPTAFVTADAESDADLDRLYQASLLCTHNILLCGSFGLAAAWARACATSAMPASPPPPQCTAPGSALVISGSAHPISRAQIQRLAQTSQARIWAIDAEIDDAALSRLLDDISHRLAERQINVICPSASEILPGPRWRAFSRLVSQVATGVLEYARPLGGARPDLLVIIGGETAGALFERLDADSVELLNEAAPGLPYGRLSGGSADQQLILTKAGGFGQENTLSDLLISPPKKRTPRA